MSPKDLPMMPWFPKQFDASTKHWAGSERGAYRELLDAQWILGVLPEQVTRLARIARMSDAEFAEVWPMVSTKFVPVEGGIANKRLEQHRKQSLRLAQAHALGARTANEKRRAKRRAGQVADDDAERTHKSISESESMSEDQRQPAPPVQTERSARAQRVPRGTSTANDPRFLDFKLAFPTRDGAQPWRRALKAIQARLREGYTWEQLIDGAHRYAAFCEAKGQDPKYVMQAATFCGPDKHFLEAWTITAAKPTRWEPPVNGSGHAGL